jgi:uncharacterized membrane protein
MTKSPNIVIGRKTLYKAITWRMLSIILSFSLSFIYLTEVNKAMSFTIIYAIISTVLYYFHEIIWKR